MICLFKFFISGVSKEVLPESRLWQLPLSGKTFEDSCDSPFTTGDYFLAACEFLSKDNFLILKTGLKSFSALKPKSCEPFEPCNIDQIISINIFIDKHGAFYHPLKVEVTFKANQTRSFVLNGAVSQKGLALVKKEYNLLCRLNKDSINQADSRYYLPQVFGFDFIDTNRSKVGFFLGQWFDNYKEFHITENNDIRQISIWESDGRCEYIEVTDALDIYREIAGILTYYYNLETFDQILSWHHAAGDFIVNFKNNKIQVKLITIRAYSSLTHLAKGKKNLKTYVMPSLLFFFLDLTIRVRIDKLNGTGKTVLIDKYVLNAIIEGFLLALDEKSAIYGYGDLKASFIEFFLQFDFEQIVELMENLIDQCYSDPAETTLIIDNLNSHCRILYSIINNF